MSNGVMSRTNSDKSKKPLSLKAVLLKSKVRFASFKQKLSEYGVDYTILDFKNQDWIDFDYNYIDFIIYYPTFIEYSSNHPLALHEVYDNLMFIHSEYPNIKFYPDPKITKYYNDKYRQYLFLKRHGYPIPETVPLFSEDSVDLADKKLGYPMIVKNRYGAGGGSVFSVFTKKELKKYYNLSKLNLFNLDSAKYLGGLLSKRIFYYHLIRERRAPYPFLSPPLLAQKFVPIERDLKTVVGDHKIVEGHWRIRSDESMWKMNIDGGGIGEWSKIPQEAMDLSVRLSKDLEASWINLDIIVTDRECLVTEFSPVWHHYGYKEKPNFVYKDDYNIDIPLHISLDLERMIIESLIRAARTGDDE
jgi:hypothetical protein